MSNARLRRTGALSAVVALIAISCASRQPSGIASRQSAVSSLSGVTPVVPTTDAGTAAALIHDHWSRLPDAPITPRMQPAVAWTGTSMLVWGGAESLYRSDSQVFADGASYDPTTEQWTTMGTAPLSARSDMGSVWTGSGLFIWGGDEGARGGQEELVDDGAMYSPATNSWRTLPPSPLSPRTDPVVVWAGHQVLVLGGQPADQSATGPGYAAGAAAYDPTTNRWTPLPAMPMTPGHDVRHLQAVVTPRGVYVWQLWQHITKTSDGMDLGAGLDLAIYDPDRRTWTRSEPTSKSLDDEPNGLGSPLLAGSQIVVFPNQGWHGDPSTFPPSFGQHSYRLDLADNRWSAMTPGPIDDRDPVGIWTGDAILEYDATIAGAVNGGPTTGPGESAVWDPASDSWTKLATAPDTVGADNAVWAGDRLLEWGLHGLSFGP